MDIRLIGRLGELLVEQQLIERGWHPVRLDTAQLASNADLVAIKGMHRVSLQVKTANNPKSEDPHSLSLAFGYYGPKYLDRSKPMFNSKPSPLVADIIVGVSYGASPRFVVLPVALARKNSVGSTLTTGTRKRRRTAHNAVPHFPFICTFRTLGRILTIAI